VIGPHCEVVISQYLPVFFQIYGGTPDVRMNDSIPDREQTFYLMSNGELEILLVDATKPDGGLLYEASMVTHPVSERRKGVPRLILGDSVLVGETEIPGSFHRFVRRALAAGADLINDVGTLADPELVAAVAEAGCPVVAMHSRGDLKTMQRGIRFDDVVAEVMAELDAAGALTGLAAPAGANGPSCANAQPAWERRIESLRGRGDVLRGTALASPDRIEGWVLWDESEGALDVTGWGAADPERRETVLELLLRHLASTRPGVFLRLTKTGEGEVPADVARAVGLHPAERYHRLTRRAEAL